MIKQDDDLRTRVANTWLAQTIKANNSATIASALSLLYGKHDATLKAAIKGQLNDKNYNKVLNWIISQIPITDDAYNDAVVLETSWTTYQTAYLADDEENEDFLDREADFVMDLRIALLQKRLEKLSD